MRKSDLVVGKHIVKYRNGEVGLLVDTIDTKYFSNTDSCLSEFTNLDDNLKSLYNGGYDVMEVGMVTASSGIFEDIRWIWKRKEYPKIGYIISVETQEGRSLIEGKVVAIDKNVDRIYYEITKVIRQADSVLFLNIGDIKYLESKGRPRATMVII